MLLVYAVAIGIVVGIATRGRLGALASVHIRLWQVALVGLFFQALLFSSPLAASVGSLGPSLYVVSTTLVFMSLIVNLRQPGFWLIIVGAFLNFAAIVANGGYMPASPAAVAALQGVPVLPADGLHELGDRHRRDHAQLPGRHLRHAALAAAGQHLLFGDVLIGAGGAWFVIATMHGRTAPRPAPKAAAVVASPASANHV